MANSDDVNPASEKSERIYEPSALKKTDHSEELTTRLIEHQTAKVPSDWFLAASFGAIGLSLYYHLQGKYHLSNMIGLWAPTLLTIGVYNKIVKTLTSG